MSSTSPPTTALLPADAAAPARAGLSPRKRSMIVRTVQYVVFVALMLLLAFSANWPQIRAVFFRGDMIAATLTNTVTVGGNVVVRALLMAFTNTLAYSVGAFVLGLVLGTVLALMKLSQVAPYRWVATVYTEIFRGLPALVVLLIFSMLPLAFNGLVIPPDPYGTVWTALGLVYGAYMSETIRAGIQAVPKGQVEAARTLGMPTGMATRRIVLPQAFRIITPPLTNELISLVKDSSLIYIVGLTAQGFELAKFGRNLSNANANLTPLMMAGLCYLVITIPLGYLVRHMEASAAAKGGQK